MGGRSMDSAMKHEIVHIWTSSKAEADFYRAVHLLATTLWAAGFALEALDALRAMVTTATQTVGRGVGERRLSDR